MIENEYRVRAVTRWVVTHFTGDTAEGIARNGEPMPRPSYHSVELGEFPNQSMAENAAKAYAKADPNKALYTTSIDRSPAQIIYPAEGEPIVVTEDTDVVAEFTPPSA